MKHNIDVRGGRLIDHYPATPPETLQVKVGTRCAFLLNQTLMWPCDAAEAN